MCMYIHCTYICTYVYVLAHIACLIYCRLCIYFLHTNALGNKTCIKVIFIEASLRTLVNTMYMYSGGQPAKTKIDSVNIHFMVHLLIHVLTWSVIIKTACCV